MNTISEPPIQSSLIETGEQQGRRDPFYMAKAWIVWLFQSLVPRVQAASQFLIQKTLTGQSASTVSTALALPVLASGTYRISLYARVTTVDSTGFSLAVTAGWTEGGIALSTSSAASAGNTTASVALLTVTVQIDRATSLKYATTVVLGTGDGRYELIVVAEQVN